MIKLPQSIVTLSMSLLVITSLSACSVFNKVGSFLGDKKTVNYQNNASVKNLEFPPDLTAPEFDKAFELPTGTVSVVSMRNGGVAPKQRSNNYTVSPTSTNISNNSSQTHKTRTGDLASIRTQGGSSVLQVHDTYSRALILTDIMLTRMGFSILSRNSAGNVYRVQYKGNDVGLGENQSRVSGWFSRAKSLVGLQNKNSKALAKGRIYQVSISNQQGVTLVRFAGDAGQTLSSTSHTKIITLLNSEFNR